MNEPMKPAPPVTSTREPSSSMLMIHPCVCARSALNGPARTDPPGSGWETVVYLSRDTTKLHGVTGRGDHVLIKGLIFRHGSAARFGAGERLADHAMIPRTSAPQ